MLTIGYWPLTGYILSFQIPFRLAALPTSSFHITPLLPHTCRTIMLYLMRIQAFIIMDSMSNTQPQRSRRNNDYDIRKNRDGCEGHTNTADILTRNVLNTSAHFISQVNQWSPKSHQTVLFDSQKHATQDVNTRLNTDT